MAENGKLGNYHLLLTHDILARSDRYRKIFHRTEAAKEWYGPRTIILDNSVVERKDPMTVEEVCAAANVVQPEVIVLPDIYKKGPETIESCLVAYDKWSDYLTKNLTYTDWSFMMVPQGRTLVEYAACAEAFSPGTHDGQSFLSRIQWWGIPRNMVEITGFHSHDIDGYGAYERKHFIPGSRMDALRIAAFLAPYRAIHLLGFSDNIIDDWNCARQPGKLFVRGIDSAVPLRAATEGMQMSFDLSKLGSRPEGWLENSPYTAEMQANIDYAKWMFGGV